MDSVISNLINRLSYLHTTSDYLRLRLCTMYFSRLMVQVKKGQLCVRRHERIQAPSSDDKARLVSLVRLYSLRFLKLECSATQEDDEYDLSF